MAADGEWRNRTPATAPPKRTRYCNFWSRTAKITIGYGVSERLRTKLSRPRLWVGVDWSGVATGPSDKTRMVEFRTDLHCIPNQSGPNPWIRVVTLVPVDARHSLANGIPCDARRESLEPV